MRLSRYSPAKSRQLGRECRFRATVAMAAQRGAAVKAVRPASPFLRQQSRPSARHACETPGTAGTYERLLRDV
jgi:hypothetical protein